MKKLLLSCLLTVLFSQLRAQTITLEECYALARQNYPAIQKLGLIRQTTNYTLENTSKAFLPQATINAQATYQSEVTHLPVKLPNFTVPLPPKDQYRVQAEISQLIYDGGAVQANKEIIRAGEAVQAQSVEVSFQSVRERVQQLYFSILLFDAQLLQRNLYNENLQSALKKSEAALKYGTTFKSTVSELQAEILSADNTEIEIKADRRSLINVLARFIGKPIDESTIFIQPSTGAPDSLVRPEIRLFELQKLSLDAQERKLKSDWLPKLSAFAQGGFGNPGLNMLKDKTDIYGIGGLRLTMPLGSLYTLRSNKAIIALNKKQLDVDKETFLLNTNANLEKEKGEQAKFQALIKNDDAIIALRKSVRIAAEAQLANGVITTTDYINKLNAEQLAVQLKNLHQLQLLRAQNNYQTISGY